MGTIISSYHALAGGTDAGSGCAPRSRLVRESLYESVAQNPLLAFLKEETRFEQLLQKLRFHLLKA